VDESYKMAAQGAGMYHSEDRDHPGSESIDGRVPDDPYLGG
jgi:hypothetical protein